MFPQRREELQEIARKTLAKIKKHGGLRSGAGRKRLGHVPTLLNLKPQTREYLRKEGGARGMGAAVDRLVEQLRSH